MEAASLSRPNLFLRTINFKSFSCRDGPAACNIPSVQGLTGIFFVSTRLHSLGRHPVLLTKRSPSRFSRRFHPHCSDKCPPNYLSDDDAGRIASSQVEPRLVIPVGSERGLLGLQGDEGGEFGTSEARPRRFTNRFLNFVRLGSLINDTAESFFKSEIRRRLFVTAVLILVSRIGYFIPLPRFDRRSMPDDYLSFASGSIGQGSSLIICVGILIGYTDTLYKMLSQLSGNAVGWSPYIPGVLGIFTIVTMWAVLVSEGCRKINLQYYAFKLASGARNGGYPVTEVEPYIPFNINPTGMQPVLTTTYLLAFPSIMASIFHSPFWENIKEILNPGTSISTKSWCFYSIYALFVFLFNIFDIANLPKEIADYMTKIGARVPNIKPGKATIEHLTMIQASTRFWGGLLLSILATTSTLLDHYLRRINENFAVGFTSVLIIVGSIIELRRSYQAYNVMPTLSKVLRRYGV